MQLSRASLKMGLAYFTFGITLVTALIAAAKVKSMIIAMEPLAFMGPSVVKSVGMLGSFGIYLLLLGACAWVTMPILKPHKKLETNEQRKHKPVLSQQTPVPR